jgi:hypothetical protein
MQGMLSTNVIQKRYISRGTWQRQNHSCGKLLIGLLKKYAAVKLEAHLAPLRASFLTLRGLTLQGKGSFFFGAFMKSTLETLARECAPQVAAWLAADPKRISTLNERDQGILIDLLIGRGAAEMLHPIIPQLKWGPRQSLLAALH